MTVTSVQRDAFRERGYFTLGRVFDDAELEQLRAAVAASSEGSGLRIRPRCQSSKHNAGAMWRKAA